MTDRPTHSTLEPRFAAIGMLPGPGGAVVLTGGTTEDAERLSRGEWDALPEAWSPVRQAWDGQDAAWSDEFNSAVVAGDVRTIRGCTSDDDRDLCAHVSAVLYRLGEGNEPCAPDASIDPRVAAYVVATRSHAAAHRGDTPAAAAGLREAARLVEGISPCAAARYLGEAAAIAPTDTWVVHELRVAADALEGLGFEVLRGELLMAAADAAMAASGERPGLLQQAVILLQKATQALPRRDHAVAYAVCHLNIAVAYLSMPMNRHASRLRSAIAVQSLREALEILTADGQPELWEAATLNLANALQHLPSSHVGKNLEESVALYEGVLDRRSDDGVGRARVLASLGNALAHLGRFDEAGPRLQEARRLFVAVADADAVEGIDGVLTEMSERASAEEGSSSAEGSARDG